MTRKPRRPPRRQLGAALLLAMLILTLVATLASGMVWVQQRAIEVEAAERARAQSAWILAGALDWARLILREDARSGGSDHLGEPWAVPLAEARLSTFLAVEQNTTEDDGPAAFLSGRIVDLQSRYNLYNLVDDQGRPRPQEIAVLQRLCDGAGLDASVAGELAAALTQAWADGDPGAPLAPHRLSQLRWLGIAAATIERLEALVVLLPAPTPVNLNTASREVIAAVIDGLDLASADRLVQLRQRNPFRSLADVQRELPSAPDLDETRLGVTARFFEVTGRLRLDDRVLVERSVVERRPAARGGEVVAIQRERLSALAFTGP